MNVKSGKSSKSVLLQAESFSVLVPLLILSERWVVPVATFISKALPFVNNCIIILVGQDTLLNRTWVLEMWQTNIKHEEIKETWSSRYTRSRQVTITISWRERNSCCGWRCSFQLCAPGASETRMQRQEELNGSSIIGRHGN